MKIAVLCLLLMASFVSEAVWADHVVVSGGPALRKWEDFRKKEDRHDRWWANFIRAATIRLDHILKDPARDASILWLVYRPGYEDRANEDHKPYIDWIENLARKRGVRLIWFASGEGFRRILNGRPRRSIRTFDYFGHSNRHAFMFEYGSDIIASSTAWLHEKEIKELHPSVFRKDAICVSWGCHTGESMSKVWQEELKVPLRGVKGPTNYTLVGQGKLPVPKGPWTDS